MSESIFPLLVFDFGMSGASTLSNRVFLNLPKTLRAGHDHGRTTDLPPGIRIFNLIFFCIIAKNIVRYYIGKVTYKVFVNWTRTGKS